MNAQGPTDPVAAAVIDGEGRLLSADPLIAALHGRAGGTMGEPLAVPQLATVARLAWRLGIPVARAVVAAEEDGDLDLWVRAVPDGDKVRLAVSGWRETAGWRPAGASGTDLADADWRWEADAALRLTACSAEAASVAGLDMVVLLGQPLSAVFAPDGAGDEALDVFARRQDFAGQAARMRSSGAAVTLSAVVRRDDAGGFAGYSGGARMAHRPDASREPVLPASFTEGLDRALRRPLARIVANADSMSAQADGPIATAYADYAGDIAAAGRHLLALIDDLIDLQAVERPDFAPTIEPIDLADVARRAAGLLAVRAADRGVTVDRPPPASAVPARGDFRRALQVAVNLLGNAIRYSPVDAVVSVEAAREAGAAVLIVKDAGKGIAADDQARIFDKFARIDPQDDGGNGLGLYIARRLARAMGGDLSVASTPGQGATFTLTLPAD